MPGFLLALQLSLSSLGLAGRPWCLPGILFAGEDICMEGGGAPLLSPTGSLGELQEGRWNPGDNVTCLVPLYLSGSCIRVCQD